MKRKQNNYGLTLVEILVAVTIIALLTAGLYSVSNYLETQAKIKLAESNIDTLVTALEQYHDFYDRFPFETDANYGRIQLESLTEPNGLKGSVVDKTGNPLSVTDYNEIYASSEALYYFLNQIPASKKIIGSLNHSLITNKDYKGVEYFIKFNIDPNCYPLIHIIDPWKSPLRYTYSQTQGNNFPLIESAGPDKDFNKTADNISSR